MSLQGRPGPRSSATGRWWPQSSVLRGASTTAEVEGAPVEVGHDPTGLGEDEGSAGMVPDLLTIIRLRRQAEIDVGLSPGHNRVLGWLSSRTGGGDPESLGNRRRPVIRARGPIRPIRRTGLTPNHPDRSLGQECRGTPPSSG